MSKKVGVSKNGTIYNPQGLLWQPPVQQFVEVLP